mmetsp:Transcript_12375/g.46170  ORF Transcript_12375/g.46170 Transcript_12375/m.46170 type:complete len:273 (-) Transcript_12375:351-1169(-)
MSPNVATTFMLESFPSKVISGAVHILHRTVSSTGTNPFFGEPFSSTTLIPTVRSTTCVSTSKWSPSRPHSTKTFVFLSSPTSRSHASPCASSNCPSKRSNGCSSSNTSTPSVFSSWATLLKQLIASSARIKCAAVPRRIVAQSNPEKKGFPSVESQKFCVTSERACASALIDSISRFVMSPSTTATRSPHVLSLALSFALAIIAGALSTATAMQSGNFATLAMLCHAGPAPISRIDVKAPPPPCFSQTRDRKETSASKSLNPNAISYKVGSP